MSIGPNATGVEPDLDDTAKLPVIEPPPDSDDEDASADDVTPVPAVPAGALELADRLREVERRLDRREQRVRELESQLGQADERRAALEASLAEARARQAELEARIEEVRAHAQQQSQLVAEGRSVAARHHEQDFTDLRERAERQMEALAAWQGFRAVNDALLDEAEARNALLESKVAALVETIRKLEGKGPRTRPQSQSEAMKAEVESLRSQIAALRAELAVARNGPEQPERVAVAMVTRGRDRRQPDHLDVPANASVVMYGDRWEYKQEPDDSPTTEFEQPPILARETSVRALVRQDGGGGVIYPLGRRTTIGRTPHNDVQIDAPNVSRHHAVVLVNGEQCRIEDLNSTNGVMVNGCRVTRQELQDGDTVTIGMTEFRFLQRL